MAFVALGLQMTFLLSAFALRTLLHLRRTGSAGFRAGAQRSPAELLGAGGITAAAALSVAGVILALLDILDTFTILDRPLLGVPGIAVAIAAIGLVLLAQSHMGASWRIGVDQTERTELVTGGLFRWTRNPIFLGMLLFWTGIGLIVPNLVTFAAVVVGAVAIEIQVRAVEEPYLLRVHGDVYRRYASQTGRLLPGLGKLR